MFFFSPAQECQKIFKASSDIDIEQTKAKVCDQTQMCGFIFCREYKDTYIQRYS